MRNYEAFWRLPNFTEEEFLLFYFLWRTHKTFFYLFSPDYRPLNYLIKDADRYHFKKMKGQKEKEKQFYLFPKDPSLRLFLAHLHSSVQFSFLCDRCDLNEDDNKPLLELFACLKKKTTCLSYHQQPLWHQTIQNKQLQKNRANIERKLTNLAVVHKLKKKLL